MLENIPTVLLFILSLFLGIIFPYIRKYFLKKAYWKQSQNFLMTFLMMFVCMLYFLMIGKFHIIANSTTIWLGLAYGCITVLYILFQIVATNTGPLSYTTVMISLSTVITALSGAIFYKESLNILKIIGIIFMIFCFVLAIDRSKDQDVVKSKIWFFFSILSFFCCAGVGLLQKAHQESTGKEQIVGFLFYSFLFATLSSFFLYLLFLILEKKKIIPIKEEDKIGKLSGKKFVILCIIYAILSGFSYAAVNQINLYLIGVVDSAIFFPIANGGNLILVALISFIIFKERLTAKQIVGLILGFISCILLCI